MQLKRVAAIAVWTFVSFWGWLIAVNLGVRLLIYGRA
jgi:hypothetical protein